MNSTHGPTRQILIPTGSCSGWVDARNAMKSKGGLPSSPLVSTIFMRPRDWAKMGSCKLIWTRNVLVYPAVGDTFKKEVDVVGGFGLVGPANTDKLKGGRWIFPGSLIPEEAIGKNGMALFLDPDDVVVEQNRIVISARPESIKVLGNFIDRWDDFSNRGMDGLVDPETKVPLDREAPVKEPVPSWSGIK